MAEPDHQEINVDKIMEKIREEVQKRTREASSSEKSRPSFSPTISRKGFKKIVDDALWRYGMRFAGRIKEIPYLKEIALRQHSRLATQHSDSIPRVSGIAFESDREITERLHQKMDALAIDLVFVHNHFLTVEPGVPGTDLLQGP